MNLETSLCNNLSVLETVIPRFGNREVGENNSPKSLYEEYFPKGEEDNGFPTEENPQPVLKLALSTHCYQIKRSQIERAEVPF